MAVVFSIPGSDRQYTYPESLADITWQQFIGYLNDLQPTEPDQLAKLRRTYADEYELNEEAQHQAKRFHIPVNGEGGSELIEMCLNKVRGERARAELSKIQDQFFSIKKERDAAIQAIDPFYQANEVLPYFCRVVSYFTGMEMDTITGADGTPMDVGQVQSLYWQIMKALETTNQDEWSGTREVEFEGEQYTLPERFMQNGTVIEFMEAAQFQKAMQDVKNGYWNSLIDVVSVILRKPGEKYSEKVFERNRANFVRMTMNKIMDIGFFFAEAKRSVRDKFPNLYGTPKADQLKAGINELNNQFGWYLTLKNLAESGIFNRAGLTPIESAEVAPLYDAFHYLSAKAAENEYTANLMKAK